MKKCFVFYVFIILFLLAVQIDGQGQVNYPEVPRVSAYEAYVKFKTGKAIIIHAGGELYEKRHLMGAFNVDGPAVTHKGKQLPNFPMTGVEIFIYCY